MAWLRIACLCLALALPARAADLPVAGQRASLRGGSAKPKKRDVHIVLKDPAIAAPFADPTQGASLRIATSSQNGGCSVEVTLDPKSWAPIGGDGATHGFLFRSKGKASSGIAVVKLKPGKITVRGGGKSWPCDLESDAQALPLRVELRLGGDAGDRYCAAFGGSVKANKRRRLKLRGAPAPDGCDGATGSALADEPEGEAAPESH